MPPARVRPRPAPSGYVEAAADVDHHLVRPARIGMPSGLRHKVPLDKQERCHVPRALGKDGMHQALDDGVRPRLVELYNAHRVREGVPCPEQPAELFPVLLEEPAQDGDVALLGHSFDRPAALKAAAGRPDLGLCQGDRPAEALDRPNDRAPRPRLPVQVELEYEPDELLEHGHGLHDHRHPGQLVAGADVGLDHDQPYERAEHALREQLGRERIPSLPVPHRSATHDYYLRSLYPARAGAAPCPALNRPPCRPAACRYTARRRRSAAGLPRPRPSP